MHTDEMQCNQMTETIIGAAHELRKAGFQVKQQFAVPVVYDGVIVGDFVADLIVNDCIVVELKSIRALDEFHSAQCINYLAATRLPVCLLLNFARKVQIKRFRGDKEVQA